MNFRLGGLYNEPGRMAEFLHLMSFGWLEPGRQDVVIFDDWTWGVFLASVAPWVLLLREVVDASHCTSWEVPLWVGLVSHKMVLRLLGL